jgi:hypothetical protein
VLDCHQVLHDGQEIEAGNYSADESADTL